MVQNEVARAALEVTRQWAIDELEAARVRATNMRCGGESYNSAIRAIDDLTYMIGRIDNDLNNKKPTYSIPGQEEAEPETPKLEELKPAPEPEPEKPARVVDLAEVRTKAKAARDAGVKLADVWAVFNATKLSEVPVEKYGDVLDILEEKMDE